MGDEQETRAQRREVGRTILSLGHALAAALSFLDRTKVDPSARAAARRACDEALAELRRAFAALSRLQKSLGQSSAEVLERLSRPSLAR